MVKLRLKELLDEKEMTAFYLAKHCMLNYNNVKKMYDGTTTSISFETLNTIINFLNVELQDLLVHTKED